LTYDRDDEFLISHGFGDVSGLPGSDAAQDPELLPAALRWIKLDSSRPFFLTLWTHDTHSPYVASPLDHYDVKNDSLNRYLNGVRATDALIGQLARALDEMNLSDNTLFIITGDHGEAFGEHGQFLHGFSVYEEETHIPLMIVNPKLIPHEITVNGISRHVDLAPTLVDLLGYETPQEWQGCTLLASAPRRAYLFARNGDMSLGVVDGNYKYIDNLTTNRRELYDLKTDPLEANNLARDPAGADMMAREHLRLAAWLAFQNRHIAQLGSFTATH
jgi:lipoteichoic acid synthase